MTENPEEMNILFSSDENYAQHLGASIQSLLAHNTDVTKINVYIIDNAISDMSKERLFHIIAKYKNAEIRWISFAGWREKLNLNMTWKISLSSYARLFVAGMLPDTVERVLYMDCDMIVCSSLKKLWQSDLSGQVIGAVQDYIGDVVKQAVNLKENERYFNAGLLLVDLCKWRAEHIEEKCLRFIADRNGAVVHHDQGVLNSVFRNKWVRLPLQNNLMTIHYLESFDHLMNRVKDHSSFYDREEIEEARKRPVVLHFTPSFTSRPWVKGCKHPLKNLYWEAVEETPWRGAKPIKDNAKWYMKLLNWRYRHLPF